MNGSPSGIVFMDLEPTQRARLMGIPVRLRRLGVSLEQPDAFLAALGVPPSPA